MAKECAIEGCEETASTSYPLCKKHLEMHRKGEIYKNPDGQWVIKYWNIYTNNYNRICWLCGEPTISKDYAFCKECNSNVQERKRELDIIQNPTKLKDYYYNAKDYAMRLQNKEGVYYQELTMVALSNILNQSHGDYGISTRLDKDIQKLNENLKNSNSNNTKNNDEIDVIKTNNDREKAKSKKTQDGHFVESEFEIKVDDLLYTNNIVHAYNIKVDEIFERTVYCDWYIPILFNKGIYIELWGVNGDEKYEKNKKEKIELYKKHKLKLIEIEYDELKDNTQRLKSVLISKIKAYKREIIDSQLD